MRKIAEIRQDLSLKGGDFRALPHEVPEEDAEKQNVSARFFRET